MWKESELRMHFYIQLFVGSIYISGIFCLKDNTKSNGQPELSSPLHHLKKRNNVDNDYPESPGFYNPPPSYNPNPLQPLAVAGSAGIALKALKAKSILKLLKVPVGLALMGGVAALAAGLIPPAVIGSINLPFQGKRKKRSLHLQRINNYDFMLKKKNW